jgi:long-chain acyl-CoA synthetase
VQSLVDFVAKYAAHGNEVAVRNRRGYRMETWTYARIAQESNRLARELEFRGISKGDAVLLWGESSPEWIISFFGCLLRGAVTVPIDHASTAEFASRVAREVSAKLIFRSRALPDGELPVSSVALESLSELTVPLARFVSLGHIGDYLHFRNYGGPSRRRDFSRQRPRQH